MYLQKIKAKYDYEDYLKYLNNEKIDNKRDLFILDSSLKCTKESRYSIIPLEYIKTFKLSTKDIIEKKNIAEEILQRMEDYKEVFLNELEIDYELLKKMKELPFRCGFVGYMDYDYGLSLNNIKKENWDVNSNYYNFYYDFYISSLIFDHLSKEITYVSFARKDEAKRYIETLLENVKLSNNGFKQKNTKKEGEIHIDRDSKEYNECLSEYVDKIAKIKDYIYNGDVYQINYTRNIAREINDLNYRDMYSLYLKLRDLNKSTFGAFVNIENMYILSSSPERLFSIKDNTIETRPIKGTIARGTTEKEDEKNKNILLNSVKDKAELLMIVDLERNDLGRICEIGSVRVPELYKLETYKSVHHLVATIQGELKKDISYLEIFKSIFPGGSITGTPKIRAMEIIDELENFDRRIYTGSLGYIDIFGNMDFNIMIRTIYALNNKLIYNVGGGITYKSDSKSEFEETEIKAKPLERIISENER